MFGHVHLCRLLLTYSAHFADYDFASLARFLAGEVIDPTYRSVSLIALCRLFIDEYAMDIGSPCRLHSMDGTLPDECIDILQHKGGLSSPAMSIEDRFKFLSDFGWHSTRLWQSMMKSIQDELAAHTTPTGANALHLTVEWLLSAFYRATSLSACAQILTKLLRDGANPFALNKDGHTPFQTLIGFSSPADVRLRSVWDIMLVLGVWSTAICDAALDLQAWALTESAIWKGQSLIGGVELGYCARTFVPHKVLCVPDKGLGLEGRLCKMLRCYASRSMPGAFPRPSSIPSIICWEPHDRSDMVSWHEIFSSNLWSNRVYSIFQRQMQASDTPRTSQLMWRAHDDQGLLVCSLVRGGSRFCCTRSNRPRRWSFGTPPALDETTSTRRYVIEDDSVRERVPTRRLCDVCAQVGVACSLELGWVHSCPRGDPHSLEQMHSSGHWSSMSWQTTLMYCYDDIKKARRFAKRFYSEGLEILDGRIKRMRLQRELDEQLRQVYGDGI